MIREKSYITDLKTVGSRQVTFGDGATGKIMEKGRLNYPILPAFYDVLLVEGLIANLINIVNYVTKA